MKEQEANKDDGFTRLEGMPFKAEKLVYHNAKMEDPESEFRTVIALTDNGLWFSARKQDSLWKFSDGKMFDPETVGGDVVAWFYVPTLQKVDK